MESDSVCPVYSTPVPRDELTLLNLRSDGTFLPWEGSFHKSEGTLLPPEGSLLRVYGTFLPLDGLFLPKSGTLLLPEEASLRADASLFPFCQTALLVPGTLPIQVQPVHLNGGTAFAIRVSFLIKQVMVLASRGGSAAGAGVFSPESEMPQPRSQSVHDTDSELSVRGHA